MDQFLRANEIRYVKYRESSSILGKTFGMLVLQDFHDLTANNLARTTETISGGGAIVLLLDTINDIEELRRMPMSFQKRMRADAFGPLVNRFNTRFLALLNTCQNLVAADSEFNLLPTFESRPFTDTPGLDTSELKSVKQTLADTEYIGPIVQQIVTNDQARVFLHACRTLETMELGKVIGITAPRGRGKSAALGLSLAFAIAKGYVNIFVTAPSPANVQTLFEFVLMGFALLTFSGDTDYDVVRDESQDIIRINVHRHNRQTICYILPSASDCLGQCELLAIDEAAAIPLPIVRKLIGPYTVLLSSTVNGYEGTGRSLSLKLFAEFRRNRNDKFSEVVMTEPIRYAPDDPIERWLCQFLCLDAEPAKPTAWPFPDRCELMLVNRDLLFSGRPRAEELLTSLVSLSVASHYRNEPDDLFVMSDAPSQRLFALLPPLEPNQTEIKVLCYIQLSLEGRIPPDILEAARDRGERPEGDLIPWTLRAHFNDDEITARTGIRIIRIAVHPDLQGKGYGGSAIRQLLDFYGTPSDPAQVTEDAPLLKRLNTCEREAVDFAGVAFGLTEPLFNFWRKCGFRPVYISHKIHAATGEHSAILLRGLTEDSQWIDGFTVEFRKRFGRLLGFHFKDYSGKLCDAIFASIEEPMRQKVDGRLLFSEDDIRRLHAFSRQRVEFPVVLDLIPRLCEFYFERNADVKLSRLMQTILIVIGFQNHSVNECADGFQIGVNQVFAQLQKLAGFFVEYFGSAEAEPAALLGKSAAIPA
jgi:N-acetyltransferase 10